MKIKSFIFIYLFLVNYLFSQTNEIILGKRFESFKFNETTIRQVKNHFKGKNKTIEKGISSIRTVNKCYSQKHLTINYFDIGLSFNFRQNNKSKKYLLKSITLDSLSKDYINYSIQVNTSMTKDVIQKFGQPKSIDNEEMVFGSNSLVFKFTKDSIIRQIIIYSNRLHYITEADF